MHIHPTAEVSPHAEVEEGVTIGPYSIIGDHVYLGQDTEIGSHVVIEGHTRIGARNRIYPFVIIGTPPQDVGYRGEDTRVTIGDDNLIREYTSIHRATTKQDWVTIVGNGNYLMAYTHIAHDCVIGNRVILSNVATLGGHVVVGDYANLGGLVAIHQFVRIGNYAFLGGQSGVDRDIPPFMMAAGARAKLYGINRKGLSRHGFSKETTEGLKKAYSIIWRRHKPLNEAVVLVREEIPSFPELDLLLDFLQGSKRGILR